MTYREAQDIVENANLPAFSLSIASVKVRQEPDDTYSVIIDPLHGEPQIYSDPKKAGWALFYFLADASITNSRYFTLSEDGVPINCDHATWKKDAPSRDKAAITIRCSSDIQANISFDGLAEAIVDMDEDVRLWRAVFYSAAKNKYFGTNLFKTVDGAKLFVNRFIELSCPEPESPHWGLLVTEFQAG